MNLLSCIFLLLIPFFALGQMGSLEDQIKDHLNSFPENCEVAIGLIKKDKEIKAGFRRVKGKTMAVQNNTRLFEIASVTKVFTASLLAREIENRQISLKDPLNKHLEYKVGKNVDYGQRIRILHLATHTSGLKAGRFVKEQKFSKYLENLELQDAPGSTWAYSNHAVALLGQIIIQTENSPWENLLNDRILEPLGMEQTFPRSSLAPKEQRMKCLKKDGKERECKFDEKDSFYWTTGAMVSNVDDMLIWLKANIHAEDLNEELSFIKSASLPLGDSIEISHSEMEKRYQGLIWWHFIDKEGNRIICHGGTNPDHTIFIAFDRKKEAGVVVYTNVDWPRIQNQDGTLKTNMLGLYLLRNDLH